jgi:hypothetical protein
VLHSLSRLRSFCCIDDVTFSFLQSDIIRFSGMSDSFSVISFPKKISYLFPPFASLLGILRSDMVRGRKTVPRRSVQRLPLPRLPAMLRGSVHAIPLCSGKCPLWDCCLCSSPAEASAGHCSPLRCSLVGFANGKSARLWVSRAIAFEKGIDQCF